MNNIKDERLSTNQLTFLEEDNENFVTGKIARRLRELGFREKCLGFSYLAAPHRFQFIAVWNDFNESEEVCSHPLWQQVMDWCLKRDVLIRKQFNSWEVVIMATRSEVWGRIKTAFPDAIRNENAEVVIYSGTHNENAFMEAIELTTRKWNEG